jgi:hypothetical protein
MAEFGSWIEKKVAELEAEEQGLSASVQEILARRREISSQLGFLRESLRLYRADVGGEEPEPVRAEREAQENEVPPGTKLIPPKLTIADAAAQYLRIHGGEARASALVEALQGSGSISPASKNGYNILQNTLSRRTDLFARSGRGVWKLVQPESAGAPNGRHQAS